MIVEDCFLFVYELKLFENGHVLLKEHSNTLEEILACLLPFKIRNSSLYFMSRRLLSNLKFLANLRVV